MYKDSKWEFEFWVTIYFKTPKHSEVKENPKIMILFYLHLLYYSTYEVYLSKWLFDGQNGNGLQLEKLGQLWCCPQCKESLEIILFEFQVDPCIYVSFYIWITQKSSQKNMLRVTISAPFLVVTGYKMKHCFSCSTKPKTV